MSNSTPDPSKECILYRIVQSTCEKHSNKVTCKPFERLFKKCPKVPAVELVRNGDVYMDVKHSSNAIHWETDLSDVSDDV